MVDKTGFRFHKKNGVKFRKFEQIYFKNIGLSNFYTVCFCCLSSLSINNDNPGIVLSRTIVWLKYMNAALVLNSILGGWYILKHRTIMVPPIMLVDELSVTEF